MNSSLTSKSRLESESFETNLTSNVQSNSSSLTSVLVFDQSTLKWKKNWQVLAKNRIPTTKSLPKFWNSTLTWFWSLFRNLILEYDHTLKLWGKSERSHFDSTSAEVLTTYYLNSMFFEIQSTVNKKCW